MRSKTRHVEVLRILNVGAPRRGVKHVRVSGIVVLTLRIVAEVFDNLDAVFNRPTSNPQPKVFNFSAELIVGRHRRILTVVFLERRLFRLRSIFSE